MLPTQGARMAASSTAGLHVMRVLWLIFVLAMVLIAVVVLVLDAALPGGGPDGRVVGAVVVGFGLFLQLLAARLVPTIAGHDGSSVRHTAQRQFFIRIAFAEPSALAGFLGFVIAGNPAVYLAGAAVSLLGMLSLIHI